MGFFLASWGRALTERVQVFAYEALAMPGAKFPIRDGLYVFASLDRGLGSRHPPSARRAMASALHAQLVDKLGPQKVLNHPLHSLGRHDLLKALQLRGINNFCVWRVGERPGPHRFPVFVRDNIGSETVEPALLGSGAYAAETPAPGKDRLAIEFCDTADADGVYRKYGALVIGNEIVPRHVFFSRRWFVKGPDLSGPGQLAEELAYLESDAHAETLREVCRTANIGYGRIDYALLDGRPQIWEINHSPELVYANPDFASDPRAPVHRRFAERFSAALDRLESKH